MYTSNEDYSFQLMHRLLMQDFALGNRSDEALAKFYDWPVEDIEDMRDIYKMCKDAEQLAFVYTFVALNDTLRIEQISRDSYAFGKEKDYAQCVYYKDGNWYVAEGMEGFYTEPFKFANAIDACEEILCRFAEEDEIN